MIIFILGKDKYRSREKLNEILDYYKNHNFWLNFITLEEINSGNLNLNDVFFQNNLFSKQKAAVFLNCLSWQPLLEEITRYKNVLSNSKDIFIFFQEDEAKIETNLSKDFKNSAEIYNFDPLSASDLKKWIKEKVKENKFDFEEDAFKKFLEYSGENLFEIQNALDKIFAFKNYGKTGDFKIKNRDIELLLKEKGETKIFETIEHISRRNKRTALKLLEYHYQKGDSPLYLFSMIVYQFRNLILLSYLLQKEKKLLPFQVEKISEKAGLSPFVVKKGIEIIKNFAFQELKKIYSYLYQIDNQIKSGKIDPELSLKVFIAQL